VYAYDFVLQTEAKFGSIEDYSFPYKCCMKHFFFLSKGNLICERSLIEDILSQVRCLNSRPAAYETGAMCPLDGVMQLQNISPWLILLSS
jgi:hypothetical protein